MGSAYRRAMDRRVVKLRNETVTERGRKFQTMLISQIQNDTSSVFMDMLKKSTKILTTNKMISETIKNTKVPTSTRKQEPKKNLNIRNNSTKNSVFDTVTENMTIVTAYFNLGTFQKGYGSTFTSKLYFTVDKNIRISRQSTVYSQPGYPKHHPNTVIPAYSSAQHAKYAVVADAVRQKYFNTEFYAWLDIGYFRDIVSSKTYFRLDAPSDIDRTKLAMNRVYWRSFSKKPFNIMRQNVVWVGGGMFIGTKEIVLKFEKLYHKAVNYFLSKNLMNTDQQVIYSMYSDEGRAALKPDVELQLYIPTGNGNPWFYQGYLCRHALTNLTIT
ncbi:hypothetical protein KUTeg_000198 [Tegillarca granosa]|uniref:Capsid protein n=1 Tax=Tegillarca granosa TaxID=220873 RepID=A0ABQ9FWU7_TEGGR|nr:hypothetical protein KUTeg_000198 [Tegillarca granosa]